MEDGKKEKVVELFENYAENVIGVRDESDEISPHRINFDINNFKEQFCKLHDIEWLDRLIILFEYNKQRIIYKTYQKRYKTDNKNDNDL